MDMLPKRYTVLIDLTAFLLESAIEAAEKSYKSARARRNAPASCGKTLRPGMGTPLWNELCRQLKLQLRRRGDQTRLARELGLPRQRINAFVTGRGRMPDAERTLQLMAWMIRSRSNPPRPGKSLSPNG